MEEVSDEEAEISRILECLDQTTDPSLEPDHPKIELKELP